MVPFLFAIGKIPWQYAENNNFVFSNPFVLLKINFSLKIRKINFKQPKVDYKEKHNVCRKSYILYSKDDAKRVSSIHQHNLYILSNKVRTIHFET